MTIYRTEHNKNYTVVNNSICKDNSLSWKAKGIWLYAFSRPDVWEFHINDLIKQSTDGKDSVYAGLKELEKAGYLIRTQKKGKTGRIIGYDWTFKEIAEKPIHNEYEPQRDFPDLENPDVENPPLVSTESIINTEKKREAPSLSVYLSYSMKLAQLLLEKIREIHPKYKIPDMMKWANEIDKMIRLDARTETELIQMIEHIYTSEDDFWSKVIKSPTSLRNNYDQIFLQMSKVKTKPKDMKAEENKKQVDKMNQNKEIAKEVASKYKHSPLISVICHEFYVSITHHETKLNQHISYSENGFKQQLDSILRKIL